MLGCLTLPRMLAAHAALAPLQGNPKAIALAVSLLHPNPNPNPNPNPTPNPNPNPNPNPDEVSLLQRGETGQTRPLAEVAALLGRDLAKGDQADQGDRADAADWMADVPDACRATLERLHALLRPGSG